MHCNLSRTSPRTPGQDASMESLNSRTARDHAQCTVSNARKFIAVLALIGRYQLTSLPSQTSSLHVSPRDRPADSGKVAGGAPLQIQCPEDCFKVPVSVTQSGRRRIILLSLVGHVLSRYKKLTRMHLYARIGSAVSSPLHLMTERRSVGCIHATQGHTR